MADFTWAELEPQLPFDISYLHKTIVWVLVEGHHCVARRGAGPILPPGTQATPQCRICFEALAGDLTLRHESTNQIPGVPARPRALRPCQRTYHLHCLVEWAATQISLGNAVHCPGDRLELISAAESQHIYNCFDLRASSQHPLRDIDNVIRFWEHLDPAIANPPRCDFEIALVHPLDALAYAARGSDVGVLSADAVSRLPLDNEQRAKFRQYNTQTTRRSGRDRRGRQVWEKVYVNYIYIDTGLTTTDTDSVAYSRFTLIPIKYEAGRVFRRFLLGMLGEIYYISLTRASELNVARVHLSDQEVIHVHAETETRRLMLAQRGLALTVYGFPQAVTWYWPFSNQAGGIVIGGTLPHQLHPARGYDLHGLNVGQTNDQRFAILANNPALNAVQQSARLVDTFIQAQLPVGFPRGYGLYQDDYTGTLNQLPSQPFILPMPGYPIPLPGRRFHSQPLIVGSPERDDAPPSASTQPTPHVQPVPQVQLPSQAQSISQGPAGFPGQQSSRPQAISQPQPPLTFTTNVNLFGQVANPFGSSAVFPNPTLGQAGHDLPIHHGLQQPLGTQAQNPFQSLPISNPFGNNGQPILTQQIPLPDGSNSSIRQPTSPQDVSLPDLSSSSSSTRRPGSPRAIPLPDSGSSSQLSRQTSSSGLDRAVYSHSSGSGSGPRSRRRVRGVSVSPIPPGATYSDSDDSGLSREDIPYRPYQMDVDQ